MMWLEEVYTVFCSSCAQYYVLSFGVVCPICHERENVLFETHNTVHHGRLCQVIISIFQGEKTETGTEQNMKTTSFSTFFDKRSTYDRKKGDN